MLKKTITYTDYNDAELTEDFYFNLSKVEIAEMTIINEGFEEYLVGIVKSNDGRKIMDTFRMIIEKSVGLRSEDGRRFIKSQEITEAFMQTGAYDELFMQLVTDADFSVEFVRGILPASLVPKVDELNDPTKQNYTTEELMTMSPENFDRVAGSDPSRMTREHLVAAMARKNHANRQPA